MSQQELQEYYDNLSNPDNLFFPTATITQVDTDWTLGWE
jgi:hypothetical protein